MSSGVPPLNILIAYPYAKPELLEVVASLGDRARLLIDSGAFTAWRSGKSIDLDAYCQFLRQLPLKPFGYFMLDVIGQPEQTQRNYQVMLDRGLRPIPIFTRGDTPEQLEAYYETSEIVGMGGVSGGHARSTLRFINAFQQLSAGRKVHWLGFLGSEYLKHYRPFMVDSAAWARACTFGRALLYTGHARFSALVRKDCVKPLPPAQAQAVAAIGFDARELARERAWRGGASYIAHVSAASAIRASLDIERNLGTKVFLGTTTIRDTQVLIETYARTAKPSGRFACPRCAGGTAA